MTETTIRGFAYRYNGKNHHHKNNNDNIIMMVVIITKRKKRVAAVTREPIFAPADVFIYIYIYTFPYIYILHSNLYIRPHTLYARHRRIYLHREEKNSREFTRRLLQKKY